MAELKKTEKACSELETRCSLEWGNKKTHPIQSGEAHYVHFENLPMSELEELKLLSDKIAKDNKLKSTVKSHPFTSGIISVFFK